MMNEWDEKELTEFQLVNVEGMIELENIFQPSW